MGETENKNENTTGEDNVDVTTAETPSDNRPKPKFSVKKIVTDFFKYWKVPDGKNEVPNKEIVALSIGGMGVKGVFGMVQYIQMAATCFLVASIYKLGPKNILLLFIICNLVSIIKTPFASWLIDNTNSKWGKFRPYMLWAGIPALIGLLGMVYFVPLNGTPTVKMVIIAIFYNIYSIGQQVQTSAYVGLTQVISPNTGERNKILSFSEVLGNLGPSIIQLFLPLMAGLIYGGEGLTDIRAYRLLVPVFGGASFLLSLVIMFCTKERVIYVKEVKNRVKFRDGIKLVGRNRDFWIVTWSKTFNGFKGSLTPLLGWICVYQLVNSSILGVLSTIVSTAFVPGMILAPLLMKKIGNGKSAFICFSCNAVAAVIMLLTFRYGVVFFCIALYLYNFAQGPQYIMQTSITADALDEIQLASNERVEGFAQNFQMMFETIGNIAAQFLFMLIYEKFGLSEGADGTTDYSVLSAAAVREPIFTWIIVVTIVASVLASIPFIFTKMTAKKHDGIIAELERKKAEAATAETAEEAVAA